MRSRCAFPPASPTSATSLSYICGAYEMYGDVTDAIYQSCCKKRHSKSYASVDLTTVRSPSACTLLLLEETAPHHSTAYHGMHLLLYKEVAGRMRIFTYIDSRSLVLRTRR